MIQANPAVSVRVLRTISELDKISREWQSWPGNRDSEMETYVTFLQSNDGSVRPHIVVVEREGRPDAILVGRVDYTHIACRFGYWQLKVPVRVLVFVAGALRGESSPDNCDLIVSSVLEALSNREADAAYMNFLRVESPLCRLSMQKPGFLCRDYVPTTQSHFEAVLPFSVDEFYMGLSKSVRGNVREKQRKLIKHFREVEIRCCRSVTELDGFIQDVEQVAAQSYQRGLGVGFMDNSATRKLLRLHAERGQLRGYMLYIEGKPSAFMIGDVNEGTFGSNYTGYDEELSKYSPGMYLMVKVIESLCEHKEEGVVAVNFGPGYAWYKEALCNREWKERAVYIFAPTVKAITLNMFRLVIGAIDLTVKRVLQRTMLFQRVKRAWRNRATPRVGRVPADA